MENEPVQNNNSRSTLPPFMEVDEAYWSSLLSEKKSSPGKQWSDSPYTDDGRAPRLVNSRISPDAVSDNVGTQEDWELARNTYGADETVELHVSGFNSGGLLVMWKNMRGFIPASQLVNFAVDVDEKTRRDRLAKWVGKDLKLRVIELDVESHRLIFSERAAHATRGQRLSTLQTLKTGAICEGVVTNLCDFGAFVDLGGIEGLIHISELSWGRVTHPHDILKSGQHIRVYVMSVDAAAERVALSIKRLEPDPWQSVEQRFTPGQVIDVTVTNVVDFGAFAAVEDGLEGLIHISELAEGQFLHPRNVIREGDKVRARILNIDGRSRRLGLSLRYVNSDDSPH